MTPVIQLDSVWKSYVKVPALRGLSLCVPQQSIYGFLGPNGAGKSTTIRLILGLQRPDRGTLTVLGKRPGVEISSVLGRIGSLVEAPSLYPNLTGREHLEVHRRLLGAPRACIEEALRSVDMTAAAGHLVRGYSTGMRQRLGIAQALLGNPELLVLDEPTNGLDPAGIHEIRNLIHSLPQRCGVTVFVSSHLLAEVEQLATHVAIISEGQLRFEGNKDELRIRSAPAIVVEVDDAERACGLLTNAGMQVSIDGGEHLRITQTGRDVADINALLVREGLRVSHLAVTYPTLEDTFLNLTAPLSSHEGVLKTR